ncbi:TonB-dependent receptor [Brevundimonas sp.]|uniref:TonB-dependent receptor n=1 Tax=Brevundimonas sp. TaxID=1871086 RepID=UPI003AFFAA37
MAVAAPAAAQTKEAVRRYAIAAGPLDDGLRAFGLQSGQQLLYPPALTAGRRTAGVQGDHSAHAALERLLAETGLAFRRTRPNTWVVFDPSTRAQADAAEAVVIDEVIVTGTLLRGAVDGPSPVVVVSRDRLDREGRATVAEALAALPQNFGGTANEAAIGNGGDRTGSNANYANGVNLRGLGSDATLVLVNGRRIAGTGSKGDFADVSSIPTAAVERIDILLDGASALYGADAVGGVVNIVLRDDYDGAETRARYGAASDGAFSDVQFAQTFGRKWSGGNLMAVYEHQDRDALPASERPRAGEADLRRFGGSDRRLNYSNPGNIMVFDPVTGAYRSAFAIPAGQDGTALRPGDFLPGQENRTNQRDGVNVLPRQKRHIVYLTAQQDLGDRLTVSGDARWAQRRYETQSSPITTLLTVNRGNPYFVSPTGAASHMIGYSFAGQLPNPTQSGEVETLSTTFGADLDLGRSWRLSGYVAYGREESLFETQGSLQSTYLREALGAIADNPITGYNASRDGFLNPFGAGAANPSAALAFISSGWNRLWSESGVATANLMLDGELFQLPGGPLKLAVGAAFRRETFDRKVDTFTSGTAPTLGALSQSERDVAAAYAEARIPLFGSANARPGLRRLELSLAARFEDYADVGQTTSPKVGVVWEPIEGALLRANYGRSFRAPALREINDAATASPSILPRGSQQILSMILYGGNPDLEPETADTFTIGGDFRPAGVEGLRISVNVFRTDFENRIGQPALENILTALTDQALTPFARLIDPRTNAQDRADMQAILDLPTTNLRDLFPATDYGAIIDARYVNTASVQVQGADLTVGYDFDVGSNAFDVLTSLTWLDRFEARATPTSAAESQLDRPNYPVSLRSRTSLSWTRGPLTLGGAVDYLSDYQDLSGRRIGSWTTMDLQGRWSPVAGPLAGTTFSLVVKNLFDRDPPLYDAPEGVAYDAANANVVGRYISLQLTRSW